tara:strand:- start:159 stop:770 length:612 start_codon:yes stop_codon:yes gene_type:complete
MQIIACNSVPIATVNAGPLLNEKELAFLKNQNMQIGGDNKADVSIDSNLLYLPEMERVRNIIDGYAEQYMKNVLELNNEIYPCQSWIARSKAGDSHPQHAHKGCLFSAVYYVYGKGRLSFNFLRSRINEQMNFSFDIIRPNDFNSDIHHFNTYPGFLIFFPGHILHEGKDVVEDKMILGANYFVKGFIGETSDQVDRLKIKPY